MSKSACRWGILSTANIARKNWQAIRNSGNGVIAAVASRDLSRSRQFVEACQAEVPFPQAPRPYGSYEALLESPDVDAVYIPLPTGLRKEWVLRAAEAGKHVVCEKPCGTNLAEVQAMTEACRQNKVQFMDGVMFMHSARLPLIRQVLDQGERVGRLKRMTAMFSFCAPEDFLTSNIRMHTDLEPHGCLGDLGWYCIRFFLWTMNWQLPKSVQGRILTASGRADSPQPVPTEFSAELLFDGGVSASFYCSFLTANQQHVVLSGEKGYLRLEDFVLPLFGSELAFETNQLAFEVNGCRFCMEPHPERHAVREYANNHETAQETHLFRNFSAQVLSGQLNPDWPDWSLKTQQVLEECLSSAKRAHAS